MYPRVVPWVAVAIAAAGAAHAQSDPLLVRLNGTKALTQRVFPALAARNGGIEKSLDEVQLASEAHTVLGFGLHSRVWLTDVRVEVPVASDDLRATFAVGPASKARLQTDYHFDGRASG